MSVGSELGVFAYLSLPTEVDPSSITTATRRERRMSDVYLFKLLVRRDFGKVALVLVGDLERLVCREGKDFFFTLKIDACHLGWIGNVLFFANFGRRLYGVFGVGIFCT